MNSRLLLGAMAGLTLVTAFAFAQCSPTPLVFNRWSTFCDGVEHTTSIALGDIDKDGDLDPVFGNGRHLEETDWVFSNDGHGTFFARRPLGTEPDPTYGVALGDLDGDGSLDVDVANDTAIYRSRI